jgi:hypothetical protein
MATTHVTARRAAINTNPTDNFGAADAMSRRPSDRFSLLLTSLLVATAQQRASEAATHERMLKCHAEDAWRAVESAASRITATVPVSDEDRAFFALALVIARLASTRGQLAGYRFHRDLMNDPSDLLGLFRHARCQRSARLMAAAFSAIDRLSELRAFSAQPQGPEPVEPMMAAA